MPIPTEQPPMVRTTARERIYKTLQQWIVNGTLLPEERLNDADLARHFSVSRTPVREALQMLAEQKLVTMVPSSGTYVSSINLDDMVYVYELLANLQSYAIELAIDKITEEHLHKLRSINESFYHYAQEKAVIDMTHADWEFHHLIAELAGNPYLLTYTEQLLMQANRNEIQFFKTFMNPIQSFDAHNRIITALQEKNLEDAKANIQQNWYISVQ